MKSLITECIQSINSLLIEAWPQCQCEKGDVNRPCSRYAMQTRFSVLQMLLLPLSLPSMFCLLQKDWKDKYCLSGGH